MPPRSPVENRLRARLANVEPDPVTGCIIWPGAKSKKGYGVIGSTDDNGKASSIYVHRLVCSLALGVEIPSEVDVRHSCDRPSCVAADHLSLGDRQANMDDAVARDRVAHGEDHPGSTLSEADVIEIVRRVRAGEVRAEVARSFGVANSQITNVMDGTTWSRVTGFKKGGGGRG